MIANMLNWWQWMILLSVPPLIIMLYFLKLRRIPMEVPSTYLWRRTVEDLHVNSIWQRLRKNLLLLLQLLAVLAFILACLRPGIRGEEELGDRSIFMIDNSSSMQATDLGKSRLELAKEAAKDMVELLGGNDVAMVIAFSDRADVKQSFTADKKKLRAAIDGIKPTNRTTDLTEALRAASGLANPGRTSQIEDVNDIQVAEALPASLYVMSDGGFGVPQLDLGNLSAEYISIGSINPNNAGILAFTVERNVEKPEQIEAFGRVQNFGENPVSMTASLFQEEELIDATSVDIDPKSSTGVNFQVENLYEGKLRLELDIEDDFELDNVAFAGLDPPRQLEVVLVTQGNVPLEAALSTEQAMSVASVRIIDPASLNTKETKELAASGNVDLFIYDQCTPEEVPASNTMYIGAVPPSEDWKASEVSGPQFVIDTNRSHPMMQYVNTGSLLIVEAFNLDMPPGGTSLLRTDAGILFGVAPRGAFQDAVLGLAFARRDGDDVLPNTDWQRKRSFPVFMLNALEYLGGAVATAGSKTIQPGRPATLSLATRFDEVQISGPEGNSSNIKRSGQPQLIYTETEELGFYEAKAKESEQLLQMFTVNLFSERESDIVAATEVQIGAQNVAANTTRTNIVRVEYWRWILAAALVLLCVEWYLYNKRVAV